MILTGLKGIRFEIEFRSHNTPLMMYWIVYFRVTDRVSFVLSINAIYNVIYF